MVRGERLAAEGVPREILDRMRLRPAPTWRTDRPIVVEVSSDERTDGGGDRRPGHIRLDALERTVEQLGAVRGTASSPDGRVTARVDGSGALEGLELAEPIGGTDPRELAAVILATVHEAARQAAAARESPRSTSSARLAASDDVRSPSATVR